MPGFDNLLFWSALSLLNSPAPSPSPPTIEPRSKRLAAYERASAHLRYRRSSALFGLSLKDAIKGRRSVARPSVGHFYFHCSRVEQDRKRWRDSTRPTRRCNSRTLRRTRWGTPSPATRSTSPSPSSPARSSASSSATTTSGTSGWPPTPGNQSTITFKTKSVY